MRYQPHATDHEVTLEPELPATATVLLLHGLGADGWDFVPIAGELQLPMPVRYDIKSFTPEGRRIALSTYLPFPARLEAEKSASNADVPILMCHGRMDPVVNIGMGIEARTVLESQGYQVEWREYPMEHEVCATELAETARWLRGVLAPQTSR